MPQATELMDTNGGSVKVGTTGKIGSLMSQELDSMKNPPKASSSSRRRHQTAPVSVPCGASPKKAIQRKNPQNGNTGHRSPGDGHKPRRNIRENGHQAPMLSSDSNHTGRNPNIDKVEKKGHAYIAQVVDIKCSNPMSSRLRKLGFSKLSESIA
ncbi:uncharacterized protein [Typha latifolia]|uniref:uncharacterized protein n=1 Tax=Typha latifolia TaxID=4733 RepID=UPI003C2D67CE